jgi:hypothetical protein
VHTEEPGQVASDTTVKAIGKKKKTPIRVTNPFYIILFSSFAA